MKAIRTFAHTAAFALIVLVLSSAAAGAVVLHTYSTHHGVHVTACTEDMPCWDCATMGNRICGGDHALIVQLMHACGPVNTGGGVTQCAQPPVGMPALTKRVRWDELYDRALLACIGNDAYRGVNAEDTHALLVQCVADYEVAHTP